MARMSLSREGRICLQEYEAFSKTAYLDSAGKWTIGYGHLILPHEMKLYVTEKRVITEADGDELMQTDLMRFVKKVNDSYTGSIKLSQNAFDAFVILAFNIGVEGFAASSALRFANQGDLGKAASCITLFNVETRNGEKVRSRGLIMRRAREAAMFLAGYYGPYVVPKVQDRQILNRFPKASLEKKLDKKIKLSENERQALTKWCQEEEEEDFLESDVMDYVNAGDRYNAVKALVSRHWVFEDGIKFPSVELIFRRSEQARVFLKK